MSFLPNIKNGNGRAIPKPPKNGSKPKGRVNKHKSKFSRKFPDDGKK